MDDLAKKEEGRGEVGERKRADILLPWGESMLAGRRRGVGACKWADVVETQEEEVDELRRVPRVRLEAECTNFSTGICATHSHRLVQD